MLPQATVESLSFFDALFTATSATCVTGLIVVDTAGHFTLFGECVILALIQIGGLGIMTLSTFFIYLVAGRLGYTEREILQDTLSQHPMADFARLLRLVLIVTLVIELLGCGLLTLRFLRDFTLEHAFYLGLFHSVSAFCNAGFSLFSTSFEAYRSDVGINLVICTLIILGGLGFVVLFDIFKTRGARNPRSFFYALSFHSRLVLSVTALLIVAGTVTFFVLETNNSLDQLSFAEKLLASFFQSVTTRTAGFNTVRIGVLSDATLLFIILFMFIGASPGSCGGGIKTSTFAVIAASVWARFKTKEDVNIYYRRIPENIVSRAISVVFFFSVILMLFTMLILISETPNLSHAESDGQFMGYLFEVVSAAGTVGLSTGLTSTLSDMGKVLITVLMFIGRLGPLTVALAVRGKKSERPLRYVQENVLVG